MRALFIIEVTNPGGVFQQLPDRHLRTEAGERGEVTAHGVIQIELARFGEHQDAQGGELLAATRQVKNRVGCDRPAGTQVGQAIAGRMHNRAGFDDRDRKPRVAIADLAADIIVNLCGRSCVATIRAGNGCNTVPKLSKQRHGDSSYCPVCIENLVGIDLVTKFPTSAATIALPCFFLTLSASLFKVDKPT